MNARTCGFFHFTIVWVLALACVAGAQTPAGTAILHGEITDPSGALIPGATVTVTTSAGAKVATTTADAGGAFAVRGLAAGSYIVRATFNGFAPFQSPAIPLAAGQSKLVNISMAIEAAQQNVVVTTDAGPTVSVEADSNANAVVIKGKDIDALSDNPDELANELSALAGPAAGPNGGQIYIDGFSGGQLPPKSAIREIRVNQNPFSAEFDHLGYGRIEILTKPGTDQLHGRFFVQGNDNSFNTGNPFTKTLPSYHSVQYNGSVGGALSKNASFFVSAEQRNNQNASVYSILGGPVLDPTTGLYSADSTAAVSGGIFNPQTRTYVSPRIDVQLGKKDTLTLRYSFFRSDSSGNFGETALPTQSTSSNYKENSIQLSDSHVFSDHLVNETRIEYERGISSSNPVSTAPSVSVSGIFSGGGAGSQYSTGHSDHIEFQNITTMTAGAHAIKFGTWLRDNRSATSTNSNFNGSFVFPSINAFVATANGVAQGKSFADMAAACQDPQGCLPILLTYTTGKTAFLANVFDGALFFQDDWKVNPFLTFSTGLRWETQNHIADHSDWGPRLSFAYALDGHKDRSKAKTVLRGGFGLFYDRFDAGDLMSLERNNGSADSQKKINITNPQCYNGASLSNLDLSTCGTGTAVAPTIVQLYKRYRSPYTEQLGFSVERQITKMATMTLTYLRAYGVHQMATRNSNAYLPGTYAYGSSTLTGVRPDPSLGIVRQMYPEAVFKQNQLVVNVNANFTPNFGVRGFYTLSSANSNTGTASNSYNLSQDYGPASWVPRHRIFLMGSYSGPWGLSFNPFLIAQTGRPYDIVTNTDLTGDAFFNSRPAYASSTSLAENVVHTSYGNFDIVPQPGETIVPANMGHGPAAVAVNLRMSRSFGIGPKVESAGQGGAPQRGGMGGGFGGIGGGHGHGGFFGGGGHGGMSNTGRRYSLTFSVQALNMFNNISYGTPVGTIVRSQTADPTTGLFGPGNSFGTSRGLAGGIFSSGSAARRVFIQSIFSF